jgi:hypothetical protein
MIIFALLQGKVILPQPTTTEGLAPSYSTEARVLVYLSRVIAAALFTFIFTKIGESKPGLGHGVRYGLGIGLLLLLPGYVAGFEFSGLAVSTHTINMVVGLTQYLICGAVTAQLYKATKA